MQTTLPVIKLLLIQIIIFLSLLQKLLQFIDY